MSAPSRKTRPVTRAVGTVSCMRLIQRRKVDFPQPDGPMIAVTDRSRIPTLASRTARTDPKYALRSSTRTVSVSCAVSLSRRNAGREADDEDDREEDEGARPGLGVPFIIGADCIREDLKRERRNRLAERRRPEVVAEGGEQKRCGFARDPRHSDESAGDDSAEGGAEDDRERCPPARVAEGERSLAK